MKSTDVTHVYNENYFLNNVDGYADFHEFDGSFGRLHSRYQRNIEISGLSQNDSLLEIGCGRGEICIFHSRRGGRAKGIDYSAPAIQLARNKARDLLVYPEFVSQSFHEIDDSPESYDVIIASEFIEHISKSEGENFVRIAYRLLKPGGKLFIFTHPNTLQRKIGYPILRMYAALKRRPLPRQQEDTLDEHYKLYHLNEQSYFSLKNLIYKTDFKKITIGYDIPHGSRKHQIIMRTPLQHIFGVNLYLLAQK